MYTILAMQLVKNDPCLHSISQQHIAFTAASVLRHFTCTDDLTLLDPFQGQYSDVNFYTVSLSRL